ncbi:fimbrial chaperone protein [Variovorax sp. HW608]|uniref:fimbrial biogenesis chaperone n=1 Tax=Variovorax sp. HW608 TaxID=1034889 RepID=UPI00081FA924|nr:molecular chaperone [Variovorax sp. HW608]SCK56430.1 fimbrial chaperone protein [Variovorax sp. HW608]
MRRGLRLLLSLFVAGLAASSSLGSVVMTGTRVIYPGGATERSIQFTNQDDVPNVVQVWVDSGDPNSTPQTANAPFVVTPPVFRIEPKAGQTARLIFTGKDLPQDRESVFFINAVQIPALNSADADRNKMLLLLRNRVKLFYRPSGISGEPERAAEKLRFSLSRQGGEWKIVATNDSAFHVSLTGAQLVKAGRAGVALQPDMVAPRSTFEWRIKSDEDLAAGGWNVKFVFVNDYGGENNAEAPLVVGR